MVLFLSKRMRNDSNMIVDNIQPIFADVDFSDLKNVWELNQAHLPAVSSVSLNDMEWFKLHASSFQVAYIQDKLAGFIITLEQHVEYPSMNFQWFKERYENFLYIDRIAIADFAQRTGLGTKFYNQAIAWAIQRGLTGICCEYNIRPENIVSKHFHRKLGFQEVGQQDTDGGKKRVSMQYKSLENTP